MPTMSYTKSSLPDIPPIISNDAYATLTFIRTDEILTPEVYSEVEYARNIFAKIFPITAAGLVRDLDKVLILLYDGYTVTLTSSDW
jgi:hypothetical protein